MSTGGGSSKRMAVGALLVLAVALGGYFVFHRKVPEKEAPRETASQPIQPPAEYRFREDIELLVSGQDTHLDRFVDHADEYLPFLIGAAADHRSLLPFKRATITNIAEDSFEAIRHLGDRTVSDCARTILLEVAPFADDFYLTSYEDLTDDDRQKASEQWREWYDKNKDDLYWDDKQKVFHIRTEEK